MADEKKAPEKKKATSKATCYEVKGNSLSRKNKFCPKCGPGIFLAAHKDRVQCGRCGYMEKQAKP